MSLNDGRILLSTHIQTNWVETPIAWDEDDEDYIGTLMAGTDSWVFVSIDWDIEDRKCLNSTSKAFYNIKGALNFKIYCQISNGAAVFDQLTDSLTSMYKTKPIPMVRLESIPFGRKVKSGPWNVRILQIPFVIQTIQDISI